MHVSKVYCQNDLIFNLRFLLSIKPAFLSSVQFLPLFGDVVAVDMPSLLSRYFSGRLSSSSKSSDIICKQQAALTDCIAETRWNIHRLLSIIELCHWGLLNVGRSVKAQLPLCPREQTEEYDRRVAVEALITKSTFKIAHDNETDETNGSNGTEPPLTPPPITKANTISRIVD